MGNHPFNVIVILFWFATMGWLVVAKILPPMRVGEPPNYASILQQSTEPRTVCWRVRLQDRTIGWAAGKVVRRKDGITSLESRVYLGDFAWEDLIPGWLAGVLRPVFNDLGELDIDKKSRLDIDPLGRLVGFESRVRVAGLVDAIKVQGQIEGSILKLSVQSGEFRDKIDRYLPPNALMTDELSPQALMPGLRVGQTWTVPMYSPFRAPSEPIEILQAVVEREDKITWAGKTVNSRLIVYRPDAGSGLAGNEPRGRVWVRDDGVVLRQEVAVLRSHLQFIRLSDEQAENIALALGEDWSGNLPRQLARRLLRQLDAVSP
jgi:hypothetical protein